MPVSIFSIEHADISAHYFPSRTAFGAGTKPTATAVGEMIDAEAARLAGALAVKGMSASTISTDAGTTYPAAYEWCRDTIRLGAAIRVLFAVSGAGPVYAAWKKDLEARYQLVLDFGHSALGDAPAPSQLSPRSHVSEHGLDRGDLDLLSDVIPAFRKNDVM